MDGLIVYPENMMRNLEKTGGLIYSQSVLLALVRKGITREEAYKLVQKMLCKAGRRERTF